MKNINDVKKEISSYIPFNDQEVADKRTILKFIDIFDDALERENIFGHLTASAFVIDEDFTKTLMIKHNIFGGFAYPGGHADGDADLLSVAKREVLEETGIDAYPYTEDIFAIQALPVKGHVKKGVYVSSHTHYDILYLLMAQKRDMDKIRVLEEENSAVSWFDLDNACGEETVREFRPINEKIIKKMRVLSKK